MYKINQVALMLGVSTVDIHSQLIEQRDSLAQNIHKNNGITFIDEEGIKLIARLLEDRMAAHETTAEPKISLEAVGNDLDSALISPFEVQGEKSLDSEMLVFRFRENISRLKAQINRVDQEILLKDEAIDHYLQDIERHLK